MSSPRQTLSYLMNLFAGHGIRPKSKWGQNFLIDLNLLDLIVRSAELTKEDLVLEVGCGTGSLTTRLAEEAGAVLGVELDRGFHELTLDAVGGRERVVIVQADILKNKNELNPEVLTALAELKEQTGCTQLKLVSNLPYGVATPVIANLLLTDLPFERMVVTVQWEIAERLTASSGTRDYGSLAILVQSLADVSLIRRLAPTVFWPRPEVSSAIVMIVPNAAKRAQVGDVRRFRNFLRDLYVHRRKNLRGGLIAFPGHQHTKQVVDQKLAELGLDGTTRAEDLDLEQHRRLSEAFGPSP